MPEYTFFTKAMHVDHRYGFQSKLRDIESPTNVIPKHKTFWPNAPSFDYLSALWIF